MQTGSKPGCYSRGTMKYNKKYTSEYIPKLQIHQHDEDLTRCVNDCVERE